MTRRIALVVLAAVALAGFAPTPKADALLIPSPFVLGLVRTFGHPDASPPGANDWSCVPSAAHPRPVVLAHGLYGSMSSNMGYVSAQLKAQGYCVFALNYGGPPLIGYLYGVGPVAQSGAEFGAFVDHVLQATHASQVDVVGHSNGGMVPRWYMKFLGGAPKVHTLVGLSANNHGNSDLNAYEDTLPGVEYTVIQTKYDEIVTPYQSAFLDGPNVHNYLLQDVCPLDFSEHLGTAFDPIAMRLTLNALDPSHAIAPTCTLVLGALG